MFFISFNINSEHPLLLSANTKCPRNRYTVYTMRFVLWPVLATIIMIACDPASAASHRSLWVTAYYPSWVQNYDPLKPDKIDYTTFSHLIQFAITPNADGSIDATSKDAVTPDMSAAVITPAHAAGRKVLICVGGSETANMIRPAITDAVRPVFIKNLIDLMTTRGYDGVDIDFEPLEDSDVPAYSAFITDLRAALNAAGPGLLLTAAVGSQPQMFAKLQADFDQINVMTYDMAGPWEGWVTWFNSPLFTGGATFPDGKPLTSVDFEIKKYIDSGIAKDKLAIGIDFEAQIWNGATAPQQSINGVTMVDSDYSGVMDKYFQPDNYRWDSEVKAPYLSIAASGTAPSMFITFDDPRSAATKVDYARKNGLGGVIVWQIGSAYRDSQPAGKKDVAMQAVKKAWGGK